LFEKIVRKKLSEKNCPKKIVRKKLSGNFSAETEVRKIASCMFNLWLFAHADEDLAPDSFASKVGVKLQTAL
jgi:hypothetical protein